MYSIALKMLFGDKAKLIILVVSLAFATLLITQQFAIFIGLMRWSTSTLRVIPASIWVVSPKVEQLNQIEPMRDIDLARVKTIPGVAWALPLYQSVQVAKLADGRFYPVFLVGIDSTTLLGVPPNVLQGQINYLRQANAVIVDAIAAQQLSVDKAHPLALGDTFEINDHEARVVGIVRGERSFFGYPFVYTTYERANEIAPKQRKNLSYILVQQDEGVDAATLARRIEIETGLKAFTKDEFLWSTIFWFFKNTAIPSSFGITVFLGLIVGIAVSGQTFYMFVLENIRYLGVLKAMGANTLLLSRMLILQALTVGVLGFGIGAGFSSLLGIVTLFKGSPPYYLPLEIYFGTALCILLICCFAAIIAIRPVAKLESAEVFRG